MPKVAALAGAALVVALLAAPSGAGAQVPNVMVASSTDTSPCTDNIWTNYQPVQHRFAMSEPGSNPASVCFTGYGVTRRITVGTTGTPPAVTYSTDTSPCTFSIWTNYQPFQARLATSEPGEVPASLCFTAQGIANRVTIDPSAVS
jgi:hypothetical protein